MSWTLAFASIVIGLAEMRSMILPLISTSEGAESAALLPSKIRTPWKRVDVAGAASGAPCAKLDWQAPINSAASSWEGLARDREEQIARQERITALEKNRGGDGGAT